MEFKNIQRLARVIEGFEGKVELMSASLPLLNTLLDTLNHWFDELVDNDVLLSDDEMAELKVTAELFHVLGYDCIHNKPTPETVALGGVCAEVENICLSAVQHCKGLIDPAAGQFYGSEQNFKEVVAFSMQMWENLDTSEPTNFVEID